MPNLGQIFTHNGGILVNAAFLLVTSAMLVGQAGGDKKPAPTPPPAAAAPVVSTGCGPSGCGCNDACGCDSFGHKLRDRLRSLFARNSCDTCDTCKPAPTCHTHTPLLKKSCDTCDSCRPSVWTWQRRCHEPACNTCAPKTCDTCGCGSHAFLDRLREGFRRKECCDTCSTCGSAPAAPPAKVEPIAPPKKMPDTKKPEEKKPAQVRIATPPAPIPTVPTVEITPEPSAVVPVPRVEGDRRDPF
jgi:hypothetical protein